MISKFFEKRVELFCHESKGCPKLVEIQGYMDRHCFGCIHASERVDYIEVIER